VIPDAAVEAAAEAAATAMWEQRPMQRTDSGSPLPFGEAKACLRTRYTEQARAALAAAAPHILAGVESIAARLERSKQCEDREIAEDLRAALSGVAK